MSLRFIPSVDLWHYYTYSISKICRKTPFLLKPGSVLEYCLASAETESCCRFLSSGAILAQSTSKDVSQIMEHRLYLGRKMLVLYKDHGGRSESVIRKVKQAVAR